MPVWCIPRGRAFGHGLGARYGPRMRYLVEPSSGDPPFPLDRDEPLEVDQNFMHENRVYIVRFVEPGRDEFDGVAKVDLVGTAGPGQQAWYRESS
jgi:hypothetical protein